MRKNHQYILGLGYEFISMTASCGDSFSKLVDRARQLERISIEQGVSFSSDQGGRPVAGSSSTQQPRQQQMRFVPGYGQGSGSQRGRFNRRTDRRPFRGATYRSRASSSSGQSSGHSSAGSAPSACQQCGRVHQGPYYISLGACFRCGQFGHMIRSESTRLNSSHSGESRMPSSA